MSQEFQYIMEPNFLQFDEDIASRLAGWTERDRQVSWLRLAHIQEQPDKWPEPVRHLPLLGRWAAHMTGNILLDKELVWEEERLTWPFTWEDDLERVQKLAEQVKPYVKIMQDRMSEWLIQDFESRINSLARFIINGTGEHELDW